MCHLGEKKEERSQKKDEGTKRRREEVTIQDVVQLPVKKQVTSTRKRPEKVPDPELTSAESLEFIKKKSEEREKAEKKRRNLRCPEFQPV